MKRLRSLLYYTTSGLALGYLICLLLFFNVAYQMMIGLPMVMYICLGFGIMLGIAFSDIKYKYLFFALEIIILAIAIPTGKLINILYITKEALQMESSVYDTQIPFFVFLAVANIIDIWIVATLSKYQKVYTRAERKEIKAKELKLSDLRSDISDEEKRKIKNKRRKLRWLVIIAFAIFMAAYLLLPGLKNSLNHAFATISKLDVNVVIAYLRSYGKMAAVVSFILMILQSIAAPIPAFLITLSNAAIFGWVKGAILSWSSAMAGAAFCFFIARALGRDIVEKLTSKGAMESVDVFFERYGKYAILICRLLPFVSFDFVSYGAGLTNMSFWSFFVATGIGQLPATIVYSYVGGTLSGGAQKLFVGLLTLFALSILIGIIKKVYNDKHKDDI